MDLVCLGTMVLLVTPTAMELSVWKLEWGRSQPIYMRDRRRGYIYLEQMKRPASYALLTKEIPNLMIWAIVRMGTLIEDMGTSSYIMV